MNGVKVFDLAKELGMSNGELLNTLKDLGVEADSLASVLERHRQRRKRYVEPGQIPGKARTHH
jgi:hypothetical protein